MSRRFVRVVTRSMVHWHVLLLVAALMFGCNSKRDQESLATLTPPRYAAPNWPKTNIIRYRCEMTRDDVTCALDADPSSMPNTLPGFVRIRGNPVMPPFYKGTSPIRYTIGETPGRGYTYGHPVQLFYEFPAFRTEFVITNDVVVGARTKLPNGTLVAEAVVRYFVKKLPDGTGTQGIEIREYHYDDSGKGVMFSCQSEIDSDTGFKVTESGALGTKRSEYYFLWPVG